ncbi:MAG: hypothetical protein II127_01295 [Ruminococcus sp.]|nr:hypothetical protein [Ruminococcus sp.]
MNAYTDILPLPRRQPRTRTPMPISERAAQFAPFAALSGYDEHLAEQARLTDRRPAVCDEDALLINDNLSLLLHAPERLCVHLSYYIPDARKPGGAVRDKEGEVRRVDTVARTLIFSDKTVIPLDDILSLAIL